MINLKKARKYLITATILIVILYLTFHSIYDRESWMVIGENLKTLNYIYILMAIGCLLLYFICQGIYMKGILGTLNHKITLRRGTFYAIIEFFFSGITPSSTGGQPIQLLYMTKDEIPIRKSYITLMLNTIYFKVIILTLGICALIFHSSYLLESALVYKVFFALGFICDLILTIACFFLIFKTDLVKRIFIKLITFLKKFKILRKKISKYNIEEVMERYREEVEFIKTHVSTVIFTFIITFVQRLCLFSIIYIIYRALGFDQYSYFDLLAIQVSVQIAMEAAPLPGGAGLSESFMHNLFVIIFASKLADVGMLLTRAFSFYIPLIATGIIILLEFLYRKIKKA